MELALSTPVSHPPLLAPSSQTVASLFRVIHERQKRTGLTL